MAYHNRQGGSKGGCISKLHTNQLQHGANAFKPLEQDTCPDQNTCSSTYRPTGILRRLPTLTALLPRPFSSVAGTIRARYRVRGKEVDQGENCDLVMSSKELMGLSSFVWFCAANAYRPSSSNTIYTSVKHLFQRQRINFTCQQMPNKVADVNKTGTLPFRVPPRPLLIARVTTTGWLTSERKST
jgi:hypothetical protein